MYQPIAALLQSDWHEASNPFFIIWRAIMALTNLGTNQDPFTLWKKDAIRVFREELFFKRFMGSDDN